MLGRVQCIFATTFAHLNAGGTVSEAHSAGPKAYSVGPKAHSQGQMMVLNMYSYIIYSGKEKGLDTGLNMSGIIPNHKIKKPLSKLWVLRVTDLDLLPLLLHITVHGFKCLFTPPTKPCSSCFLLSESIM